LGFTSVWTGSISPIGSLCAAPAGADGDAGARAAAPVRSARLGSAGARRTAASGSRAPPRHAPSPPPGEPRGARCAPPPPPPPPRGTWEPCERGRGLRAGAERGTPGSCPPRGGHVPRPACKLCRSLRSAPRSDPEIGRDGGGAGCARPCCSKRPLGCGVSGDPQKASQAVPAARPLGTLPSSGPNRVLEEVLRSSCQAFDLRQQQGLAQIIFIELQDLKRGR
jgi:hypothetical protein